jgi:hypothetical protein
MQKAVGIIGGLLVFAIISLIPLDPVAFPYPAQLAAAVTGLMVVWLITEAIPIYVTASCAARFIPCPRDPVNERSGSLLRRSDGLSVHGRILNRRGHDHPLHGVHYPGITGYLS